jgi:hypothetical protein
MAESPLLDIRFDERGASAVIHYGGSRMRRVSTSLVAITLFSVGSSGCGGSPLSESARSVRIGKEIPHPGCRELGMITGSGGGGGYTSAERKMNKAQDQLRQKTDRLGGDYAAMDIVAMGGGRITISGRAFDCSEHRPIPVEVMSSGGDAAAPSPAAQANGASGNSPEERLQRLERLKADGIITDEEYTQKRREIIDAM